MKLLGLEINFNGKDKKELNMKETLLPYLLSPSTIVNEPDYIKIGEQYNRTIAVLGVPRVVKAGFLNPLMLQQGDFDISMHVHPKTTHEIITQLNNELVKMSADIYGMEGRGEIVVPSLKMKYDDTINVLKMLQSGEEKLYDFSFYINVRAKSIEKLNELTGRIGATLGQLSLLYKVMDMEMHNALPSILPMANNKLKITRNMTSSALAACFPFSSSNLQVMENGIVLGVNDLTNIPLIVDIFQLQNSNMFVLGSSGSGKSFAVKTLLLRLRRTGAKIFVIDPQGEYRRLADALGENMQIVDFSPESNAAINPFDLQGLNVTEKAQSLASLFQIISGGQLSSPQRSMLDEAIYAIYNERGIDDLAETNTKQPPTFQDLYNYLRKKAEERRGDSFGNSTAISLMNRIKAYTSGSLRCFNTRTRVNLDADFIVFDISYFIDKMQTVAPPAMFIILDFLVNKMKENIEDRKVIVVDEGWRLLKAPNISEYLLMFAKTARKYHASLQIITQELGDLVKSDAGPSVLANTSLKLILKQDPAEIDTIAQVLKLNPNEKIRLITAEVGQGILFVENSKIPFKSICMPEEEAYITTKPSQMKRNKEDPTVALKIGEKGQIELLDLEHGYYKKNELGEAERMILIKNGFEVVSFYGLEDNAPCQYLVKPKSPEGAQHTLMVEQIVSILKKKKAIFNISTNGDADIGFIDKQGRKIAFDVETGRRKELKKKLQAEYRQKYAEIYFVVNTQQLKAEYSQLGKTLSRKELVEKINELLG